ncbi:MAG TPA: hypothetical protein DEP23_13475 [Ruminococcaceae bacterium]|nr:hypothetical protein [Oscillospiraceae bacterium]
MAYYPKGGLTVAGLEKILEKIQNDSVKQCNEIITLAEREADAIREQARQQASAATSEILNKAEKQAAIILQKAESTAQNGQSRAVLAEKIAIIREVMDKAAAEIKSLPDGEYSEAFKKIALRYAKSGSGVFRLSPEDQARLPSDFETSLNQMLHEKGASLKMETAAIEPGGFILVYGDIEQNCTIDSLIESMQDDLKDEINRILFL